MSISRQKSVVLNCNHYIIVITKQRYESIQAAFQHAKFSTYEDFWAGEHAHWPIKHSGEKRKSWPSGNQP